MAYISVYIVKMKKYKSFFLLSPQSAARTASAAQQTSRRASAVSVCGAKRQERGCWAITVSLTVLWVIMAGMEPASVRTFYFSAFVQEGQRSGSSFL